MFYKCILSRRNSCVFYVVVGSLRDNYAVHNYPQQLARAENEVHRDSRKISVGFMKNAWDILVCILIYQNVCLFKRIFKKNGMSVQETL